MAKPATAPRASGEEITAAVEAFIRRLRGIYTPAEMDAMADAREAADAEWQHRHDIREYDRNR